MTRPGWKTLFLPAAAFAAAAVTLIAAGVDGRPAPQPAPAAASAALSAKEWEETARAGRTTPQVVLPSQAKGSPMSPVVTKQ